MLLFLLYEEEEAKKLIKKEEREIKCWVREIFKDKLSSEIRIIFHYFSDFSFFHFFHYFSDFSEKTLDIRKNLFRTAKDLRAQGKYAKVSYNRLVTNKDEY